MFTFLLRTLPLFFYSPFFFFFVTIPILYTSLSWRPLTFAFPLRLEFGILQTSHVTSHKSQSTEQG